MISVAIGLIIIYIIKQMFPSPIDYYWDTITPRKNCPDCGGKGKIEINYEGSGDFIECPCTMKLVPIY